MFAEGIPGMEAWYLVFSLLILSFLVGLWIWLRHTKSESLWRRIFVKGIGAILLSLAALVVYVVIFVAAACFVL